MATQSNNTTTTIDDTSLIILQAQLVSSVFTVAVGLPCCLCNLLKFLAIWRTKQLRTNFYLCLMHTAIADMLCSFFSTLVCAKRVVLALVNLPETTSPLNCLWLMFLAETFGCVTQTQTISIAVDRLFCLAFPLRYFKLKIKRLQLINLALWVVPVSVMIAMCIAYINTSPLISNCTLGFIWSTDFSTGFSTLGLTDDVIVIVIYCALVPLLLLRIFQEKKKGKQTVPKMNISLAMQMANVNSLPMKP